MTFNYYSGPLMAQDEIQVAENPCLAALREALVSRRLPALTVENGEPTPVLVRGAERRRAIDFQCYNLFPGQKFVPGNYFQKEKIKIRESSSSG